MIFNCNLPILEESLFLNLSAIANKSAGVYIEIKRVSWGGGRLKLELRNLCSVDLT